VHADVLRAATPWPKLREVLASYTSIHRPYLDRLRIYLVNGNLSVHWTPLIREWTELHNIELLSTPTSESYLNRIDCHFRPVRESVLNASDYTGHADVALAFRSYAADATVKRCLDPLAFDIAEGVVVRPHPGLMVKAVLGRRRSTIGGLYLCTLEHLG
jgi:hypothetical protein